MYDPCCNSRPSFLELPVSRSPAAGIEAAAEAAGIELELEEKPEVSKLLQWKQLSQLCVHHIKNKTGSKQIFSDLYLGNILAVTTVDCVFSHLRAVSAAVLSAEASITNVSSVKLSNKTALWLLSLFPTSALQKDGKAFSHFQLLTENLHCVAKYMPSSTT